MKQYKFTINGKGFDVIINSIEGTNADVTVNGKPYSVLMENTPAPVQDTAARQVTHTQAPAVPAAPVTAQAPVQAPVQAPRPSGSGKPVTAPLPGVIIELSVKEGQAVKAGEKVAVLEAMKMENEIQATCDGTVAAIHVAKGDSVLEGANIVTIA